MVSQLPYMVAHDLCHHKITFFKMFCTPCFADYVLQKWGLFRGQSAQRCHYLGRFTNQIPLKYLTASNILQFLQQYPLIILTSPHCFVGQLWQGICVGSLLFFISGMWGFYCLGETWKIVHLYEKSKETWISQGIFYNFYTAQGKARGFWFTYWVWTLKKS